MMTNKKVTEIRDNELLGYLVQTNVIYCGKYYAGYHILNKGHQCVGYYMKDNNRTHYFDGRWFKFPKYGFFAKQLLKELRDEKA